MLLWYSCCNESSYYFSDLFALLYACKSSNLPSADYASLFQLSASSLADLKSSYNEDNLLSKLFFFSST